MVRNKRINHYIPKVMEMIKEENTNILEDGKIRSEYISYVINFGAAIIQNGLLPAIAFYTHDEESSKDKKVENKSKESIKENKNKIVKLIYNILEDSNNLGIENNTKTKDLLKYVKEKQNTDEFYEVKDKIKEITIALKLVMRTYPIIKEEEGN
jgi:CRISPR-associated protein Cmr5